MANDIKKRLDNNEVLEFHNGDDLASISKGKLTKTYIFIFNSKPLFGFRTFKIFLERVNEKLIQYSLTECTKDLNN